ncbi:putative zinc-type alcohol dehydrogenase-like protein YogA [Cladobotryum mycophilum]|uniref:Zinc-type alcohol dehydrogenase-like protein YogA n=1 Tax=Cladobotryum mycophilum TaxID=491253 RepID=A0ABR0SHL7_9HYPO
METSIIEPKTMLAVYCVSGDLEKPLTGLKVGRVPLPPIPEGWVRVKMSAAAINYHDIFTLRGIGWHPVVYPRILGCEGCGTLDDGTNVILYPVMNDLDYMGDETLDPKRHVFHEITDGTLAEYVVAPVRNVLPLSEDLDPITGSVLGIAWLTAYRMLFTKAAVRAGQTILVQGSSGGVTTALIQLGSAAGVRVWCTGRTAEKRHLAETLGAEKTFEPGETLPRKVDAVFDTSGAATWNHSLDSVKAGGSLVTCGGHGGFDLSMDGLRLVADQISIHGVFAGSLAEFKDLISFVIARGIKPQIGKVLPLSEGEEGLRLVHEGSTNGKVVLTLGN